MEAILPLPPWVARLVEQLPDSHPFLTGKEWDDLPHLVTKVKASTLVGKEDDVFQAYGALHKAIVENCGLPPGNTQARPLLLRPTRTPKSTAKENSSRPDGTNPKDNSLIIDWKKDRYRWADLFLAYEFKRANKKDLDGRMGVTNTKQVIWDLQHMLWENIDRRFAVGMTIEETEARLWVATRSAMLVSMDITDLEKAKRVAIKDVWRDEHREPERKIYDRVMKAIKDIEKRSPAELKLPSGEKVRTISSTLVAMTK
ncbi:hypothetical protein DACRYDRAFT_119588 [Dacryopinax primogenitus]|uniref:Fungal-type protein kinase domain-containing protein n=1 Tax=Dacryopinax primogenitus (strain DJM 731) TaxID=1858805 RepID=M5FNA5_DACPD|nr:uncharacterized protein DACRYDRAFT_119588 [Dacryopinax primogenitus]EJT97105.1 hypothetical protein DACRYDRAFT_119588 [Dacryopinax primogenitus]